MPGFYPHGLLIPYLFVAFILSDDALATVEAMRPGNPVGSVSRGQGKTSADETDSAEILALRRSGRWSELATVLRERLAATDLPSVLRSEWSLDLAEALTRLDRREEAILHLVELAQDPRIRAADRVVALRRANALSRLFGSAQAAENYQRALIHFQAGRLPEARLILQSILTEEAVQLDSLVRLGQICIFLSDWDSAVEHLRRARSLNPFEPVVSLWLGKAMTERGEFEDARRELVRAQEFDETREQSLEWLIDLESRVGNGRALERWISSGLSRLPRSLAVWGAAIRSGFLPDVKQLKALRSLLEGGDPMRGEPSSRKFDDSGGLGCSWRTREELRQGLRALLAGRDSISR